jgi:competence ComEA-like helix-hairpin-helix protein
VGRARTTAGSALPIGVTPLVMTVFRSRIEITLLITAAVLFLCCKTALPQKTPPTQPVNINTATIAQLETLPGIGPNTAKAIVDFRNHSGPFQRVEDLLAIKGISKSKLEKLRPTSQYRQPRLTITRPVRAPPSSFRFSLQPIFRKPCDHYG